MYRFVTAVFAAVAALLACGAPPAGGPERAWAALGTENGTRLNGTRLNGTRLNGEDLSNTLISVGFDGVELTGNTLDSTWLQGSELWGSQSTSTFHGLDFDEAHLLGTLAGGGTVELWITGVQPPDVGDDVWRYQVQYYDTQDSTWYPLCAQSDGTALEAIPVEGRWNYDFGTPGGGSKISDSTVFTFACEMSAITKCLHMGYKPWATAAEGTSLAAYHQTCTRMIRADYCGDGTSYTVDGQWVNVYDAVGVQTDTEDWYFEAEWDEDGARCFTTHNRYHAAVPCQQERTLTDCGDQAHFTSGTLAMTETPYLD